MADTQITRRDWDKTWQKATGVRHTFRLKAFRGHVLEVRDVHFNFDSAVLLPDRATEAGGGSPDPARITGLAVLRAAYRQAREHPAQKILIAGHTDTSGPDAYNLRLSQLRADNVLAALTGDRATWVRIADRKHKVEDVQLILKWAAMVEGWGCDPGAIDNVGDGEYSAAVREFQKAYNEDFQRSIAEDGIVGEQTWGAFFDLYMDVLKEIMETDEAGLRTAQQSLLFVDNGRKAVGCGEHYPIEARGRDEYASVTNRRVEILFFDPGEEPRLDCHPAPGQCRHRKCEVHNPVMYDLDRIDPRPIHLPLYRITLELGDIDKLFPAIATQSPTDPGVRRRLQAVGFLYEPLGGVPAAQITQRSSDAWDHFKVVTGQAANPAAVAELQRMVREVIVDQGRLPSPGEFAMLRFPGTYCRHRSFLPPAASNPCGRFRLEQAVWTHNPSLGLIPILAKVEIHRRRQWRTVGVGTRVHFQLATPDTPPAGSPVTPPPLRNTPTTGVTHANSSPPPAQFTFNMTGSPDRYVRDEKARNPAVAGDPQVDNGHQSVGGKRGNAVAGTDRLQNVLEITTTRTGFNDTLNLAAAAASTHPNAVVADTNNRGEACLVLMPARTGGDRYKIKAFLDPVRGAASDGTESWAVTKETGTVVVFRILRLSKYLRWDYPATATPAQIANNGGPLGNFDINGVIVPEYQKAWLDVIAEAQAATRHDLTQAEWQQAIRFARSRAAPTTSQPYNLNVLIPDTDPAGAAGINNPSPGLINFRTAAQYNAAPKGPPPAGLPAWPPAPNPAAGNAAAANYWNDMAAVRFAVQQQFLEFFTRSAISGMTIIQAPNMSSLEADNVAGMPLGPTAPPFWQRSGWGGIGRGCYVVFGENVYAPANPNFPYPSSNNALHETGHVLYEPHQYTTPQQVNVNTGGELDEHDYHDLCIMGYIRCSGGFCGRCVLNYAGYNTGAMPANHPGP